MNQVVFEGGFQMQLDIPAHERIILPLDVPTLRKAGWLVDKLLPYVGHFKIGLEMITSVGGPKAVEYVHDRGGSVFYDGKFDDIPNTVAGASAAVSRMGVAMFNVHASAGPKAIKAAARVKGESLLLGVTVLTSLDTDTCISVFGDEPGVKVEQFAQMLVGEGADGIICSPGELRMLSQRGLLDKLVAVIPGIRTEMSEKDDQSRVAIPEQAIKDGADYLVIGRSITEHSRKRGGPVQAAKSIVSSIQGALAA